MEIDRGGAVENDEKRGPRYLNRKTLLDGKIYVSKKLVYTHIYLKLPKNHFHVFYVYRSGYRFGFPVYDEILGS